MTQTLAVRDPEAVGVKVTLIVQLAPGASDGHILVSGKWWGSAPVTLTMGVALTIPVFESVRFWGALVVPRSWVAKVSEVGVKQFRKAGWVGRPLYSTDRRPASQFICVLIAANLRGLAEAGMNRDRSDRLHRRWRDFPPE
ncbi:MAG TPA: hypothetical protein VG206_09695 [Terriglobia bacterium]|nr:hypothetical protein [Terriglobia bacterium]